MMQNLLSNAVASINNRRGGIEVQLENIGDPKATNTRNGNLTNGKVIQLTVRDNGQGIDPAHRDRIFDPYKIRLSSRGPWQQAYNHIQI